MAGLKDIVARQAAGIAEGCYSVCSANALVLEAAARQAVGDGSWACLEATSNQVNPFGGYTGMTAQDFASFARSIAASAGLPEDRLLLGGDHLGPNVWKQEGADSAMGKACELVDSFARAGFAKLHLDASMQCADDPERLSAKLIAERTALMCVVAEKAWASAAGGQGGPHYVIGSEVPQPGGATEDMGKLRVTDVRDVREIMAETHAALSRHGVESAWERVVAVVVQPGVEFGDMSVVPYNRGEARALSRYIEGCGGVVYEAHSTDYQTEAALGEMVADHFAVLKVGPWLTFALREGLFALESIERELLASRKGARLCAFRETLDRVMREQPEHWRTHYRGTPEAVAFARMFSYSDRCRYYLPDPRVGHAIENLLGNLSEAPIPPALLSQYMPFQYGRVMNGTLRPSPRELLLNRVRDVTALYARACGLEGSAA